MPTSRPLLLAAALSAALLVACGGAEDSASPQTTEVAQEADAVEQYCSMSAELDAQDTPPTDEQLADIEAAAPAEIAEEVATLAEAVRTEDYDAPEAQEAEATLVAWEAENCVQDLDAGATEATS
jgi:nitrous oxide reductase accessory protein NosL